MNKSCCKWIVRINFSQSTHECQVKSCKARKPGDDRRTFHDIVPEEDFINDQVHARAGAKDGAQKSGTIGSMKVKQKKSTTGTSRRSGRVAFELLSNIKQEKFP